MRALKVWAVVVVVALSAGCQKKVDGSSEEAFKSSVSQMKEGLSDEEQKEFTNALMVVAMKDLDFGAMMAGVQDGDSLLQDTQRSLDGKSREEIIAWADEIRQRREAEQKKRDQERLQNEIEEAKKAVDELAILKAEAEKARARLAKFEVVSARYAKKKRQYFGVEPRIDLEVKNDTGAAVSRAYFRGTLRSPGRSVPWLEDTFNYEISGGLEHGETAKWSLAPNMFSDWGTVEPGADAILHVDVLRLDGADGNPLFDASDWGPEQEERLEMLSKFLADPKLDD